jgi:hypothetical protein
VPKVQTFLRSHHFPTPPDLFFREYGYSQSIGVHFVHPEDRFLGSLRSLCELAEEFSGNVLLLGASATAPECEYGWIKPHGPDERTHPSAPAGDCIPVAAFVEKPAPREADRMFRAGCCWNTMIAAANASTLWEIGWRMMPRLIKSLKILRVSLTEGPAVTPRESRAWSGPVEHLGGNTLFRPEPATSQILSAPKVLRLVGDNPIVAYLVNPQAGKGRQCDKGK